MNFILIGSHTTENQTRLLLLFFQVWTFGQNMVPEAEPTSSSAQGRIQEKLMTEAMSMEDLWPRQSVHGWVLFLSIKSVYNDYKQQKWKKLPRQVPRLACY